METVSVRMQLLPSPRLVPGCSLMHRLASIVPVSVSSALDTVHGLSKTDSPSQRYSDIYDCLWPSLVLKMERKGQHNTELAPRPRHKGWSQYEENNQCEKHA